MLDYMTVDAREKNNTTEIFRKHLDGLRIQSLAKKLGLRILDGTNGTNCDD